MNEDQLLSRYPRLYHMAHDGAWPALRRDGLLSVEAIVDLYGVADPLRTQVLAQHRPTSVHLTADGLPGAVVRDQLPMSDRALGSVLPDGMTPSDWYQLLNSYSFLWLHPNRVRRLLAARAYRNSYQTVLTIDTKSVLEAHRDSIRLSPINSGSTIMKPMPRSAATFMTITDFPYDERRKTRIDENNAVEFVVKHSIPDLADHVLAVHRMKDGQESELLWRQEGVEIAAP